MDYEVDVYRIGYGFNTIEVKGATSEREAGEKALEAAGSKEFSERDANYGVDSVAPIGPS